MVRFGPGLEKHQAVLGRLVEIGADLFVMTAVIARAQMMVDRGDDAKGVQAPADAFCRHARRRVASRFKALFSNDDKATYRIARRFLEGELTWLERGIVPLDEYRSVPAVPTPEVERVPEPANEPVPAA